MKKNVHKCVYFPLFGSIKQKKQVQLDTFPDQHCMEV